MINFARASLGILYESVTCSVICRKLYGFQLLFARNLCNKCSCGNWEVNRWFFPTVGWEVNARYVQLTKQCNHEVVVVYLDDF